MNIGRGHRESICGLLIFVLLGSEAYGTHCPDFKLTLISKTRFSKNKLFKLTCTCEFQRVQPQTELRGSRGEIWWWCQNSLDSFKSIIKQIAAGKGLGQRWEREGTHVARDPPSPARVSQKLLGERKRWLGSLFMPFKKHCQSQFISYRLVTIYSLFTVRSQKLHRNAWLVIASLFQYGIIEITQCPKALQPTFCLLCLFSLLYQNLHLI